MSLVCVWLHVCLLFFFQRRVEGCCFLCCFRLYSLRLVWDCNKLATIVCSCENRLPVFLFFRLTQSRCGQNRYRYHIWCMKVLVEPTFFWVFPEVWTCNGLFAYSPGLGCLCRPLTTRNLRIRHAQTWGGLLLPFVRLYVWPTTVISLYGGRNATYR